MENKIQNIKKDFFCFRNGIIADKLRSLYAPGTFIFGLNVPQFIALSQKYPKNLNLATELWKDIKCRESRLLSLYLFPVEEIEREFARRMIIEVQSNEEAEFLAFRILRRLPYAKELYDDMNIKKDYSSYTIHCIKMFKNNLNQI